MGITYDPAEGRSGYTDTKGAAAYLGLSASFLNKSRHFGTGPEFSRAGRAVRYRLDALDAWMAENRATCTRDDEAA